MTDEQYSAVIALLRDRPLLSPEEIAGETGVPLHSVQEIITQPQAQMLRLNLAERRYAAKVGVDWEELQRQRLRGFEFCPECRRYVVHTQFAATLCSWCTQAHARKLRQKRESNSEVA